MGVQGLWQLLSPTGRPVTLESLEGKVLAIDVSLWLHQAAKGMRDQHGQPVQNAHLITLFHRVCKLLFYRIKPIFVFDGGAPLLKKQTLAVRREKTENAKKESNRTTDKLLRNLIKTQLIQKVIGKKKRGPRQTISNNIHPSTSVEVDMFHLPPLPEKNQRFLNESEKEADMQQEESDLHQELMQFNFQNLNEIDIDSEDFKALPAEIQHEILVELKDARMKKSWMKLDVLPENSDEFSKFQMAKLLKQSQLSAKLDAVKKEINRKNSGRVVCDVDDLNVEGGDFCRIVSEDSSHYVLLKRLTAAKDMLAISTGDTEAAITTTDKLDHLGSFGEVKENAEQNSETLKCQSGIKTNKDENLEGDAMVIVNVNDESVSHDGTVIIKRKGLESDVSHAESESVVTGDGAEEFSCKNGTLAIKSHQENLDLQATETVDLSVPKKPRIEKESGSNSSYISPPKLLSFCEEKKNMDLDDMEKVTNLETPIRSDSESKSDEDFLEVTMYPDIQESGELNAVNESETTSSPGIHVLPDVDDEEFSLRNITESSNMMYEKDTPNQFESFTEKDLIELEENLVTESGSLQEQRGKQQRLATNISDQMCMEAQELLRLFGLPYLVSPMEAEAQCAFLDETKQTDGTITDDSDIWLFGGDHVYKNFFNHNRQVELYKRQDIKRILGLSQSMLVNIALLCGCDYTEGIRGIGPVTALEVFAEFPGTGLTGLENLKSWWDCSQQVKVPQETKLKSKLRQLEIKDGFPNSEVVDAYMNPRVDHSKEPFSWASPDLDQLREFCLQQIGWSRAKTDEVLLPVMKQLNRTETKGKITSYFPVDVFTENKKFSSKRVRRAIRACSQAPQQDPENSKTSVNERRMQIAKEIMKKQRGRKKGKTAKNKIESITNKWQPLKQELSLSESSSSDDDCRKQDSHTITSRQKERENH